jgi:hypothetical protein
MAKYKDFNGFDDLNGKLGGFVFSHNKFGPYVKAYKVPRNPRTVKQTEMRVKFSYVSRFWKSLNGNQKNTWKERASYLRKQDSNKEEKYLYSAYSYFMHVNIELVNLGKEAMIVPALSEI